MSLGSAQKVCETRSCRDEVTVGKVPRTATQRKQRATLKQSLDTLPCDTVMGILPSTDGSCKTLHFAAEDLLRERQSCIKSMPTRDSVSRNGSSTDKESYACDATTFQFKSRKFVSLQHNKFSLKSATDKYCDGMKSKLNNVDFANRSRTPSRFGALPRPITNNVPFHYSLYRREQSPDCRFPKYRCDSHGSVRKDFNLDNASPPKRPLCDRGYEVKSSRWSYDYCGGENILKETSFVKRPCIDGTYSASGQNCARAFGSPNEYVEHAVQNSSDKAKPVRPHDATSTCSLPAFHLPMIPQSLLPSPASAATTSQSNSDLTAISPSSFPSRHHSHANASYNQFSSTFPGSTYATATNVNVSTRDSILHGPAQNRERSGSNFCNITKSCKANNTELQASKLCSCCFNRPKRFATADELA
ncbi:hypothetical protein LEL_06938 [Akanthomyces lecanii RCEF 1005]|uniref:Uncharacterized protein n=1 Tax=Akanthomyces lecanii RCEF 1005 TaxID=1081108 RepID=A0A168FBU7_CORDF|nr:hypothetical protein LEL_06938 [Akanthomyces lecanii RCEF 1005]